MEGGLQELEETAYWIELLQEAKLAPPEPLQATWTEADELIRIFVRCIKNVKRND